MLRLYIFTATLFVSSLSSFAYNPLDSIGVENLNGKKLIVHKVDPQETYYSISRKYKVNVKDIMTYNNNIGLQIGTIIKVPTDIPFVTAQQSTNTPTVTTVNFFEYTVVAKDNLNLIAQRYATTTEEIKRLNQLSSNNLQIGQVLKIPFTRTQHTNVNLPTTPTQPQSPTANTVPTTNVTEHTVVAKENLNLIAKKYNTTVEDIKRLNGLTSNNLQIGQLLKIPSADSITNTASATVSTNNVPTELPTSTERINMGPSFEHTVTANETIYTIAQKYGLTTYQLTTYNNLTSNNLTVGQKLVIKGERPTLAQNIAAEGINTDTTETLKSPNLKRPASIYGLNRVEERGTGVWITDPDLDPNKMLILHQTAPIGTVIQITNPMTNRSTFAKVVGKFTENETTKDAIIVMTKAVADAVGALDRRFFCSLSYGPKDEQ